MGSDVVVVDPPRKGLDPSLVDALRTLSLAENRAMLTERYGCFCNFHVTEMYETAILKLEDLSNSFFVPLFQVFFKGQE